MSKVYTIVGIDPGTTVGIAVLDFYGDLLGIISSKSLSVDDIVEKIMEFGTPSIVATDVSTVPQTVEKIAVSLGAKIFSPRNPISIREKNEIAKEYPDIKNAHERDSLSAAIKAYQAYMNKFENIDARLKNLGLEDLKDNVKALVVKEYSVSSAIEKITVSQAGPEVEKGRIETAVPVKKDEHISELCTRIENQRSYISDQNLAMEAMKRRIRGLESKISSYNEEARIKSSRSKQIISKNMMIKKQQMQLLELRRENKRLVKIIDELRGIRLLQLKNEVIVCKILEQFNKTSINDLENKFKIGPGEVVYIQDCSGGGTSAARTLCEKNIKAIIYGSDMSHTAREILDKCGIALIDGERVHLKLHEDYGVIDKDTFIFEYNIWKERHEMSMERKKHEWLDHMIKEYRYERKKKIK